MSWFKNLTIFLGGVAVAIIAVIAIILLLIFHNPILGVQARVQHEKTPRTSKTLVDTTETDSVWCRADSVYSEIQQLIKIMKRIHIDTVHVDSVIFKKAVEVVNATKKG